MTVSMQEPAFTYNYDDACVLWRQVAIERPFVRRAFDVHLGHGDERMIAP